MMYSAIFLGIFAFSMMFHTSNQIPHLVDFVANRVFWNICIWQRNKETKYTQDTLHISSYLIFCNVWASAQFERETLTTRMLKLKASVGKGKSVIRRARRNRITNAAGKALPSQGIWTIRNTMQKSISLEKALSVSCEGHFANSPMSITHDIPQKTLLTNRDLYTLALWEASSLRSFVLTSNNLFLLFLIVLEKSVFLSSSKNTFQLLCDGKAR